LTVVIALVVTLSIFGLNAALAMRYGADSRVDDGRSNW